MDHRLILQRLLSRTKITNNLCWIYVGAIEVEGYGQISIDNSDYRVHRVSAYLFNIIDNLEDPNQLVLHKRVCHNRRCWNPYHLYSGSYIDNSLDYSSTLATCPHGHDRTTYGYRARRSQWDRRYKWNCRECDRIRRKKNKHQRKTTNSNKGLKNVILHNTNP